MKWIFLLLALLVPGLAAGQSYNATSYTAGSFNNSGCGGGGGVCFTDLSILSVQNNGTITYCKDCSQTAPCTGGGSGAIAMKIGNIWQCANGTGGGTGGTCPVCGSCGPAVTDLIAGPGIVQITGGTGNGTDVIKNVSVNGVINPVAYGAKCDGTTNDMTALNNALAACGTTAGTVVEFPNASCAIQPSAHNGLVIPSNCTVRGSGPQSAIVELTGSTCAAGWSALVMNSGSTNISIRDFQIVGKANHSSNCVGLYLGGMTGSDIENVTVTNADSLGIIEDSSTNFKIRNNTVTAPNPFGITVENNTSSSSNFTISNNTINNSGGDSIFVALTPIPTVGTSVVHGSNNFSIIGNLIYNAGDAGIEVGAVGNLGVQNTNFVVSNNEIAGSVNNGILIRNDAQFAVTGNVAWNNGTSAGEASQDEISIYAAEANILDGTVTGNTLTPKFGSGIGFAQGSDLAGNKYSAAGVAVSGNHVVFPAGSYPCSGRDGEGVAVDLYLAGAPAATAINVTGNVLSSIPCTGVHFAGASFSSPLVAGTAANNSITGQNMTTTTGIICASANCLVEGNTLTSLKTGISDAFASQLLIAGNQFLGAITTGYSHNSSTFSPLDTNQTMTTTGAIYGTGFTPAISGGGALGAGSNSLEGRITGVAATGNILTPGFTCPNAVQAQWQDNTTSGGAKTTAQTAAAVTFSATANDVIDYWVSCR